MYRVKVWITSDTSFAGAVFQILLIEALLSLIVINAYDILGIQYVKTGISHALIILKSGDVRAILYFISHSYVIVLYEEMIFRFLPIMIMNLFTYKFRFIDPELSLSVVWVVTSVMFGFWHGDIAQLLLQGVGGFIYFGFAYKLWAAHSFEKAFVTVTTAHLLFNATALLFAHIVGWG